MNIAAPDTNCPVCHSPPVWNPAGTHIAFRFADKNTYYTGLLDPYSGQVKKLPENNRRFMGWLSHERFAEVQPGPRAPIYTRDAQSGAQIQIGTNEAGVVFFAPAPPSAPAPYIAAARSQGTSTIVLLRKDMARGKRLWSQRTSTDGLEMPRIDPHGEYVAWTGPSARG